MLPTTPGACTEPVSIITSQYNAKTVGLAQLRYVNGAVVTCLDTPVGAFPYYASKVPVLQ